MSQRVNYHDQQILRLSDLTDEQAYHLAMHRRHHLAGHIWGIVYGLQLELSSDGTPSVSAGLAIDGYGRELILPFYQNISPEVFDDKSSEALDVYLVYSLQDGQSNDPALRICPPGGAGANRRLELGQLALVRAEEDPLFDPTGPLPHRRQPPGVPDADLLPDPTRLPPDDPARLWLVFLGKLTRRRDQTPAYQVDLNGRPYAGLVGEAIRAPSGRAWVQLGPAGDQTGEPTDPVFAIFLPETPGEASQPRLAIDHAGDLSLRADSTIHGDLLVEGGAVEFGVGPAYEHAKPWSIYHTSVRVEGAGQNQPAEIQDQLRIEMGYSANAPELNRVSIGHWSDQESKWVPCLNIGADCKVEIFGDLVAQVVKAQVIQAAQAQALVRTDLLVDQGSLERLLTAVAGAQVYQPGAFIRHEFQKLQDEPTAVSAIDAFLDQLQADFEAGGPLLLPVLSHRVSQRGLQSLLRAVLEPGREGPGPMELHAAPLPPAQAEAGQPAAPAAPPEADPPAAILAADAPAQPPPPAPADAGAEPPADAPKPRNRRKSSRKSNDGEG